MIPLVTLGNPLTTLTKPTGLGRIKGVAFREFAVWYADNISARRVCEVVLSLDHQYPNQLQADRPGFGILVTQWYQAELVHGFLDLLAEPHTAAELDRITQDAATDIMNRTLSGVYKFLFSAVASPSLYAKHVSKLWGLHYNTGTVVNEHVRDNEALMRYVEWHSHHPLICKLNMGASVPIYSAMGCKNVQWRKLACVSDGQRACTLSVTWDK